MRADQTAVNGTTSYETDNITRGCPISVALNTTNPGLNLYYYDAYCTTCKCLTEAEVDALKASREKPSASSINIWFIIAFVEVVLLLALAVAFFSSRSAGSKSAAAEPFKPSVQVEAQMSTNP